MFLRPEQAHWFETYIPRHQTVTALKVLADTGLVELESSPALAQPLDLTTISSAVADFHRFTERYPGFATEHTPILPAPFIDAPEQRAAQAMSTIHAWSESVDRMVAQQLEQEDERHNLLLLQECLNALQDSAADIPSLSQSSLFLYKAVFACPQHAGLEPQVCASVDVFVPGVRHNFLLIADLPSKQAVVEEACRAESCHKIEIPGWLVPDTGTQRRQMESRINILNQAISGSATAQQHLQQDPALAAAIETMRLLSWYVDHAVKLSGDQKFCHVTGWTRAHDTASLLKPLHQAGITAEVRFSQAPRAYKPPVSMRQPAWARPFLLFTDMLGTPGNDEVDPGILLPIAVSLLFGYMFPDVGHGLLLALVSALLYQRWPSGRFLLPCGVSAAVFGLLFGEVFGIHGLWPPLWFRPLDAPLWVFVPPIIFGVFLMLLGLVFNGVEAYWRGDTRSWLLRDAPVLLMYAAACVGILYTPSLWLAALALSVFILGQLLRHPKHRLATLASQLGQLVQSLFELLLHTISFLRVGAFALGHAALSTSVLHVADTVSDPVSQLVLMVVGHQLIIAVEGLMVFVQTTRLVLFEFFTRFLKAEGRIFRPLNYGDSIPIR